MMELRGTKRVERMLPIKIKFQTLSMLFEKKGTQYRAQIIVSNFQFE